MSSMVAASGDLDRVWADVVATAAVLLPSVPLVGYERGEGLEAALATGFHTLGPLRIWRRAH